MLGLLTSKSEEDLWKPSKPCRVGIHWVALAEYFQMSTHVPGLQSFFMFSYHFNLTKFVTSSIRVNPRKTTAFAGAHLVQGLARLYWFRCVVQICHQITPKSEWIWTIYEGVDTSRGYSIFKKACGGAGNIPHSEYPVSPPPILNSFSRPPFMFSDYPDPGPPPPTEFWIIITPTPSLHKFRNWFLVPPPLLLKVLKGYGGSTSFREMIPKY